jgi:AcrR family transcriptional regulator
MTTAGAGAAGVPRRRDSAATRQALLDAARRLMGEYGVEGASTREVAAAAGVNQALVYRYFGSKEKLFAEAAGTGPSRSDLEDMRETPLQDLPRMLLDRALTSANSREQDRLTVLVAGANDATVRDILRLRIEGAFGGALAERLDGPDAALRAELLAALLAGVGVMREKVATRALAEADRERLVAWVERLAAVLFEDPDPPLRAV